ncbi:hypothetical protein H8E52_11420 [bacterium]|nr:hypothetical protein [bacterium]
MIRDLTRSSFLFFCTCSIFLTGCDFEKGHWEITGIAQVPVDSIIMADEHSTSETLTICFVVEDAWELLFDANNLKFSHLEVEREVDKVSYLIWGELRNWIGDSPMPPCGGCGFMYDHVESPPFDEGDFLVVVDQSDGSTWEKTVMMIP